MYIPPELLEVTLHPSEGNFFASSTKQSIPLYETLLSYKAHLKPMKLGNPSTTLESLMYHQNSLYQM